MIKHGFYKTLEMMANQFEPYETRLRQLPESQRQIDFEHEPTPEAVEMFMAIPRFSLFSDFFMNKDVEKGLGAACINAYHHDASMMIPKTYARLWQFARRSDHWVNLLELSSGSITNPDFFINFCAALKNQNNPLMDTTLLKLVEDLEIMEYAPKTILFGENHGEKYFPVPLDEEPRYVVHRQDTRAGVLWYEFIRVQGMLTLVTPWKLDSVNPPLIDTTDQH